MTKQPSLAERMRAKRLQREKEGPYEPISYKVTWVISVVVVIAVALGIANITALFAISATMAALALLQRIELHLRKVAEKDK